MRAWKNRYKDYFEISNHFDTCAMNILKFSTLCFTYSFIFSDLVLCDSGLGSGDSSSPSLLELLKTNILLVVSFVPTLGALVIAIAAALNFQKKGNTVFQYLGFFFSLINLGFIIFLWYSFNYDYSAIPQFVVQIHIPLVEKTITMGIESYRTYFMLIMGFAMPLCFVVDHLFVKPLPYTADFCSVLLVGQTLLTVAILSVDIRYIALGLVCMVCLSSALEEDKKD